MDFGLFVLPQSVMGNVAQLGVMTAGSAKPNVCDISGFFLKSRVTEICVKQIRVKEGRLLEDFGLIVLPQSVVGNVAQLGVMTAGSAKPNVRGRHTVVAIHCKTVF